MAVGVMGELVLRWFGLIVLLLFRIRDLSCQDCANGNIYLLKKISIQDIFLRQIFDYLQRDSAKINNAV